MPTFAAIDIGSNSVRLKIARPKGRRLLALHEDREVTRLGEAVFRSGELSPDAMAETIKVLRRFHRGVQRFGADQVRVVATSALRDARNSQAFVEWVRSATGWNMEIITGQEEARLIHLGLVASVRLPRGPALMIDLGGGSCELTISQAGHLRQAASLPLGAVRLTNEFLRHDPPRKGELERLRAFISRYVAGVAGKIAKTRPKTVLATSGTAAALWDMCGALYGRSSGMVSRAATRRMSKMLSRMRLEERQRLAGLGPRRAEIILAGALVYSDVLERCHLRGFRYSPLGLRDGMLAQMAAERDRTAKSRRQIESERWDSVQAAVLHYGVDRAHARSVRDLAMQLFHDLRRVHRLPPEYKEWVSTAAMLYEIGDFINRNGRHRHAHYIIAHSEILGYTLEQRQVIAAIARYMGKSKPLASDPMLKGLSSENQKYVPQAVVLLRLARALNLGRNGAVRSMKVRQREAGIYLLLTPKRGHGLELEVWAIEKEQAYFRELFGRALSAALA
jgi:exopolyphosphatase/guanosine-5'-triphosphate,3'-diphosphate pyrophosphatase